MYALLYLLIALAIATTLALAIAVLDAPELEPLRRHPADAIAPITLLSACWPIAVLAVPLVLLLERYQDAQTDRLG